MGGEELSARGNRLHVAAGRFAPPGRDAIQPGLARSRLYDRKQRLQRPPQVSRQGDVHPDVLVDLAGVDLRVDLLRVHRVGLQLAGDPVVEAHPQRDQEICFLDRRVHPGFTVHPHHAQAERMRRREASEAEQRGGHRNAGLLGELAQERRRSRHQNSLPREDQGPLGRVDQQGCPGDGVGSRRRNRAAARRPRRQPRVEARHSLLRVLGDVHQHRTRPAGAGDEEGLAEGGGDVLGARDQVVVLGDRQRDAGDVRLLEGVAAQDRRRHLPRDADDGRGIHHRRRDAGDEVRRARSGGGDRHSDFARRPGIAVGHVGGALLVPDQDVPDGIGRHRVVGRHDRAARVPEDDVDAFAHENFPDHLRARPLDRFGVGASALLCNCGLRRHADLGGKKKPPHRVGCGGQVPSGNLPRSGRRPAPAANERKQSDDAKKERGAKLRRGSEEDGGAREPGFHGAHG